MLFLNILTVKDKKEVIDRHLTDVTKCLTEVKEEREGSFCLLVLGHNLHGQRSLM